MKRFLRTAILAIGTVLVFVVAVTAGVSYLASHQPASRGWAGGVGACEGRLAVVETLRAGFGEAVYAVGTVDALRVLEVWLSPARGTLSIVVTQANGIACVIATAGAIQLVEPPPAPERLPLPAPPTVQPSY